MSTIQQLFKEFKDGLTSSANFIDNLADDEVVLRVLKGAHTNHFKKQVRFQN